MGYNYNAWKILHLIATEDTGSTKAGINYLSKHPYPFTNVEIHLVACKTFMYK